MRLRCRCVTEFNLRSPVPQLTWRTESAEVNSSAAAARQGTLRAWRNEDAAELERAWRDRSITRWNPPPRHPGLATAQRWIDAAMHRLQQGLALDLVIADESGKAVLGEVGISGVDSARRAGLVGYWLHDEARGAGIGAAALDALSTWAMASGGFEMLVARCADGNEASQHVARSAGYTYARDDGAGHQLWVLVSPGD